MATDDLEYAPAGINRYSTPLDCALAHVGVRETSRNRGPLIDRWIEGVGLKPEGRHPWCAAFVVAMCRMGGRPIKPAARVIMLSRRNHDLRVEVPEPGDVCVHVNANGTGHTGFYVRQAGGIVTSCEGNTDEDGGREGVEVAIRERPRAYWNLGFFRPEETRK